MKEYEFSCVNKRLFFCFLLKIMLSFRYFTSTSNRYRQRYIIIINIILEKKSRNATYYIFLFASKLLKIIVLVINIT